ncbi:MAG: DoxX family protein [Parasphingorhabdus sp.]|uniref:DoxX family protein n=1 Tax=Parasphingorhabdus sp. TaxID=2709688 RepID=UPI003001D27B
MNRLTQLNTWLAPAEIRKTWFDPIFRITTSLIFVIGGFGHFGAHPHMLARMEDSPWRDAVNMIGDPSLLLWTSGAVFIVFGTALAFGYLTRISALLILLTLIPITLAIHIAPGHTGPLFKNIAIMGALLYFYANGPGRFAIDRQGKEHSI